MEKYGLKDLKNTGHYYITRIVEKDGTIIDEILVDKQSGSIQFLRGKSLPGGETIMDLKANAMTKACKTTLRIGDVLNNKWVR